MGTYAVEEVWQMHERGANEREQDQLHISSVEMHSPPPPVHICFLEFSICNISWFYKRNTDHVKEANSFSNKTTYNFIVEYVKNLP